MCNTYAVESRDGGEVYIYGDYLCGIDHNGNFWIKDPRYTSLSDFKTYLQTAGIKIVAKRQTTQTVELGSINFPALSAPNANVWAAAEVPVEVELEYLTEDAEVLTRFLKPSNIKAGSNVSIDVDGNDVTVSSSGGGTGGVDTATDEEFQEYMGY